MSNTSTAQENASLEATRVVLSFARQGQVTHITRGDRKKTKGLQWINYQLLMSLNSNSTRNTQIYYTHFNGSKGLAKGTGSIAID